MRFILFILGTSFLVGCYPMPGDNDFSVIPATNNPRVTREKSSGPIPGITM